MIAHSGAPEDGFPVAGRGSLYSISDRRKPRLAVHAMDNAMSRSRDAAGRIVHSDRGS